MSLNVPSLRFQEFRRYVHGRFWGNVGNSVQQWAVAWHVYEISGQSSLHVGLLGLVRILPLLAFSLIGGVATDYLDRKRLMVWTRVTMVLLSLALFVLAAQGLDTLTAIYVIVALTSVARAFDGPARNAIMVSMVPAKDLPNALSVMGISWRLSDVVGPIVTGVMIASTTLGATYAVATVANAILVFVLLVMKPVPQTMPEVKITGVRDIAAQIGEGWRFIMKKDIVRNTMVIDFWATFFSTADALLPAFAGPVLNLGPTGYGLLAGASGVGALIAAAVLAVRPTVTRQGAWVVGMVGVYGMATMLLGVSPNLPLAMFFLAMTGAADMVSTVLRQTIRQLATPDEMRGRLHGVSVLFQVGGPQLGDVEAGVIAKYAGDRASVVIGGIASVAVAGIYAVSGRLRRYTHEDDPDNGTIS